MVHTTGPSQDASFETDLASLASDAAIALDDLLLGRRKELGVVKELASRIVDSLPSDSMDLTTAVAVHRALVQTPRVPHIETVNEVAFVATQLANELNKVVGNEQLDREEIERLRSFCVALSGSLIALRGSPYDRSRHLFRR